jgi:hypothetical protein
MYLYLWSRSMMHGILHWSLIENYNVSFRWILFSYFTDFVSFRWILLSHFKNFVSFRWILFSYFTDFVGFCFRFVSFRFFSFLFVSYLYLWSRSMMHGILHWSLIENYNNIRFSIHSNTSIPHLSIFYLIPTGCALRVDLFIVVW